MTITVEQAQANLGELIDQLNPGEELVITRSSQTLARIIKEAEPIPASRLKPQAIPGRGRGKLVIISEEDNHLEDFVDYL